MVIVSPGPSGRADGDSRVSASRYGVIGWRPTRSTDAVATRPRLRSWALATAGFRYPHLIAPELAHELVRSARRTDGFLPALEALADYPLEEELPKISCPR